MSTGKDSRKPAKDGEKRDRLHDNGYGKAINREERVSNTVPPPPRRPKPTEEK